MQKEEQRPREDLESIGEIGKLLSSLTGEDAIQIFIKAGEGIESSTEAIRTLNLTQKRYYVSLKRLIEAGLIEKRENVYVQTMLGKLCYNMGKSLLNALNQRDQLELADKLMKSSMLSLKEKEDVLNAISKKELLGAASLADIIHEVKMITNFTDCVEEARKLLENAKESAYVAASKTDIRLTEAVLDAINRGTKLFLLSVEKKPSEYIEILKMVLNPELVNTGRELFDSKELNLRVTKNLTYSFIVVDGEYGLIELPHPALHDFYVAFKFKNALFCQNLVEAFNLLYERAKDDPRIKFARKYLSLYK